MINPTSDGALTRVSQLPEQLSPFLTLLDGPFILPICRGCQAAVLPKSLMDHLRKHHELPAELRSTVKSLVAMLPALEFDDVPSNPDGSAPVEALRVIDAFQCRHCPFIRRDVTDVRRHINKEHQVSAADNYEEVQAQAWFGGRRAIYWRVNADFNCIAKEGLEPCPASMSDTTPFEYSATDSMCRFGFFGKGPWADAPNHLPSSNK